MKIYFADSGNRTLQEIVVDYFKTHPTVGQFNCLRSYYFLGNGGVLEKLLSELSNKEVTFDLLKSKRSRKPSGSSCGRRKKSSGTSTGSSLETVTKSVEVVCGPTCELYGTCTTPQMEPVGEGRKNIMIVGEMPSVTSDRRGVPLVGRGGMLLRTILSELGYSLDRDFIRTYVVQCRPPENKFPSNKVVNACFGRLKQQIEKFKPKLVIFMGGKTVRALYNVHFNLSITKLRGYILYNRELNTHVGFCNSPVFVLKGKKTEENLFRADLQTLLTKPLIDPISVSLDKGNLLMTDVDEIEEFINIILDDNIPVAFDFECNTKYIFFAGYKAVTISFATTPEFGVCIPIDYPLFWKTEEDRMRINNILIKFFISNVPKVIQNVSFEKNSVRKLFNVDVNNIIKDTMVVSHIIHNRSGTAGLDFQVLRDFGYSYGEEVDKSNMEGVPLEIIAPYNCCDSRFTIAEHQLHTDYSKKAYELFHRGVIALSEITYAGIKIDQKTLGDLDAVVTTRVDEMEKHLQAVAPDVNVNSVDQLRTLFFTDWGLKSIKNTKTSKKEAVDVEVLGKLLYQLNEQDPKYKFISNIVTLRGYKKLKSTYIDNMYSWIDGDSLIHPSFLLHTVDTYRSSSANPNFQNIPKKAKVAIPSAEVRKIFVPKNDLFIEVDYKAAEVRVIAMYSNDPTLIDYIQKDYDFHKYWASKIYDKPEIEVTEDERGISKNKLVFPLFYGSANRSVIESIKVSERKGNILIKEFWKDFAVVKQWQESYIDFFNKNNYVETYFGFRRQPPLRYNQIVNFPIQATAFHLLLDSLVDIHNELKQKKFKSHIVAQVHDSILIDVSENEIENVLEICKTLMCRIKYDWQCVSMDIDAEWGYNWYDMEKLG